ncbi:hypothetical protein ACJIZ3_023899 [Penstemon smallii]|uniref:Uncharacterized protein n=1 Tax=Penstemon smallii TaxID=265156 RepID=A0ABD3TST7_9LAMI
MNHEREACRVYVDHADKWIVMQLPCGARWWTNSIRRRMC